jgi:hypothetical protein
MLPSAKRKKPKEVVAKTKICKVSVDAFSFISWIRSSVWTFSSFRLRIIVKPIPVMIAATSIIKSPSKIAHRSIKDRMIAANIIWYTGSFFWFIIAPC